MIDEIKSVLLVEDDDNDIIITKRKLRFSSIPIKDIFTTKSIEETRDFVKHNQVDVMLLDLNLTDSLGLDSLKEVRKFYQGVVVVLTSIDDINIGTSAINQNADDFLVKSQLDEKELGRSILFALERRKIQRVKSRLENNLDKLDELAASDKLAK
jgi:DNA-binding NarL/FixJ family response regulator